VCFIFQINRLPTTPLVFAGSHFFCAGSRHLNHDPVLYAVSSLKSVQLSFLINSNECAAYSLLIIYLRYIKQKYWFSGFWCFFSDPFTLFVWCSLTVQSNINSTCVAYEVGGDMGLLVVFASSSKLYDRNQVTWGFHTSWVWCWNDIFSYPDFLRERSAVGASRSD